VFVSRAAVILLWGGEEGKKESPGPREGDQRRTRSSFPKPSFFTYRGGDELLVVGTGLADEPGVAARHGDAGGAGLAGRDALAHEVLVSDGWGHGCLSSSVLWCSLSRARVCFVVKPAFDRSIGGQRMATEPSARRPLAPLE